MTSIEGKNTLSPNPIKGGTLRFLSYVICPVESAPPFEYIIPPNTFTDEDGNQVSEYVKYISFPGGEIIRCTSIYVTSINVPKELRTSDMRFLGYGEIKIEDDPESDTPFSLLITPFPKDNVPWFQNHTF